LELCNLLTQKSSYISCFFQFNNAVFHFGVAVAQLIEALRYKPEGGGFDY
jgi:hypothetical protein